MNIEKIRDFVKKKQPELAPEKMEEAIQNIADACRKLDMDEEQMINSLIKTETSDIDYTQKKLDTLERQKKDILNQSDEL